MKKAIFLLSMTMLLSCEVDNDDFLNLQQKSVTESKNFVSLEYAQSVAVVNDGFYTPSNEFVTKSSAMRSVKEVNTKNTSDGVTACYIVNLEGGGFRIVSADNRLEPILAHSETGAITEELINYSPGLQMWLEGITQYISEVKAKDEEQSQLVKTLWSDVSPIKPLQNIPSDPECSFAGQNIYDIKTYGPFIQTNWHQHADYNSALDYTGCSNSSNNGRPLLGCTTVAAGIAMRCQQKPSYLNWGNMPLSYSTSTTAAFLRDLADKIIGLKNLGCDASGGSIDDVCSVLKNYYGYTSVKVVDYSISSIHTEMSYNSPVIMRGSNGNDGHEWVISGMKFMDMYECVETPYQTLVKQYVLGQSGGYFIDWGWDDSSDGWYSESGFKYPQDKKIIINIR